MKRQRISLGTWPGVLGAVLVGLMLLPVTAAAQDSGVEGVVADETGAVLPGVTAVLSSPNLIGGDQVRVSNGEGFYQFTNLPVGVFQVMFTLPGFSTIIRDEIRLTTAFVAAIDVQMGVAAVEETITVSGQSPVVDVTSAATVQTITQEVLDAIPTSASMFEVMAMAPGMRIGRIDVGGSTMANYQSIRAYGYSGQITPTLDGINTRQATGSMGSYYDFGSMEELTVTAVGNGADIATAGMAFAATIKSGTNNFHGDYKYAFQNASLQGANIDAALQARGVKTGNNFRKYTDYAGSLGGPIVPDRIWFFADFKHQGKEQSQPNFSVDAGADGIWMTADDDQSIGRGDGLRKLHARTVKLTFQLSQNYKIDGFYHRSAKIMPERYGTQFRPLENTNNYLFNPQTGKIELTGTPNNQLVFTATLGRHYYLANYQPRDGSTGTSRFDREGRLYTGAARRADKRPRNRWQYLGDVTYYPANGDHAIKAGVQIYRETHGTGNADHAGGNFFLEYESQGVLPTVYWDQANGGMTGDASRIIFSNYPVYPTNRVDMNSFYVMDDWKVSDRFTANIGVRLDRYNSYVPQQGKPADDWGLFASGQFPRLDVVDWSGIAPRLGWAYDINGDNRTVLRGTWNLFNHSIADSFSSRFNRNAVATATFDWVDTDGNNTYTPGEVDLDLNGPDFQRITASSTEILPEALGQNFKQPTTQEISVGVEHEILPGLSARAVYVHKRDAHRYDRVPVLRPYSAYSIPITRTDPGIDGKTGTSDDGGQITLYDFTSAYRGAAFSGRQTRNAVENMDKFHSVELTLQRRLQNNWQALVSFQGTKNHRWIDRVAGNPQEAFHPLDQSSDMNVKAHGSYLFRGGIQVGVMYQVLSGAPLQRTARFGRKDPLGLSNFSNSGTMTVRMEPYGSRKLDMQQVTHLKVDKIMNWETTRTRLTFEVFNLFNANTIIGMNQLSGSTFNRVTEVIPPRVARLGVSFDF